MANPSAADLFSWFAPLHEKWPETRPEGSFAASSWRAAILTDAAIRAMAMEDYWVVIEAGIQRDTQDLIWTVGLESDTTDRQSFEAPTLAEAVARAAMAVTSTTTNTKQT